VDAANGYQASGVMNSLPDLTKVEFFQAIRLIESQHGSSGQSIGHDTDPADEIVHFKSTASLAMPPTAIQAVERGEGRYDVTVAFIGALGACGVLPWNLSEFAVRRLASRDHSFLDFVDLLHHRCIAFFYRAWRKYRLPVTFEAARRRGGIDDITMLLRSLVGLGIRGDDPRLEEGPDSWLYFAGPFARPQRSAAGLEVMLEEVLGCPVHVEEFVGRWQWLLPEERSSLGGRLNSYNRLGDSLVLGDRVWDTQSGIRIRMGPVGTHDIQRLSAGSGDYPWLPSLVRSYVGNEVDFETVCEVDLETVVPTRLGSPLEGQGLGEGTWIAATRQDAYDSEVRIWLDK